MGDYVLLEKLGQGGMAMVYRAELTGSGGFRKQVAIKRMIPQYRRNPALLERFAAEARTNARLNHPNLVAVVDFDIEPEPYLVMEYVEGVTLALLLQRLVEKKEMLEVSAACFIGAEAAQGLDHAHRKRDEAGNPLGIVHRDVSPQNVLLSNEGAVKVSDFGLVKAADNVVQTGSGVSIGKISYMAPEQAGHEEVDARADVFSLGVVIWEMLAMRILIPANDVLRASQMIQTCDFPPPSEHNPRVSPELDEIVMACLTKDPMMRTPSAQAVGMSLREVLHELAPGYGREQLARLLGWAFPERGWQMDEPHGVAAQPSAEERMSIPQIAVAPPVVAEEHAHKTIVDVERADPLITGPRPPVVAAAAPARRSRLPWLWIGIFAGGGLLALGLTVVMVFFLYMSVGEEQSDAAPAVPMQPIGPSGTGADAAQPMLIEADVDGATLFRGGDVVGALPLTLSLAELSEGPLVVIAPGHHPTVLDPQRLRRRIDRGRARTNVALVPSRRPERAVLVHYPRPATARIQRTQRELGPVPGLLLVPTTAMGGSPTIEIVENGRVAMRVSAASCDPIRVCVIEGGIL